MLLPIVFVFSHAFKPPDELFAYPPRFFVTTPTIKNFTDLFARLSNSGDARSVATCSTAS